MLQELWTILPRQLGTIALIAAGAEGLIGICLWLGGAHLNRALITLLMLAFGAGIGMLLPRWMKWEISGAGPAVGAALICGLLGYALYRVWTGLTLGIVLAGLAGWIIWHYMAGGATWTWPTSKNIWTVQYYVDLKKSLPWPMLRAAGYACGGALLGSLLLGIFVPRIAVSLLWSLAGLMMALTMGLMVMKASRPDLFEYLKSRTIVQLAVVGVLTVIGTVFQWRTLEPAQATVPPKENPEKEKS